MPDVTAECYGLAMGHIIELVLEWAVFGLVVAVVAALVGFGYRALRKREWSNVVVLEGAFAIGAVMGFVWLVFDAVAF